MASRSSSLGTDAPVQARFAHQPTTRGIPRHRWKRYSNRTFFLFLSPWLFGFIALTLIPLLYALLVSFTDFDGISHHWHWVGIANYTELLHAPEFWSSLGHTILYMVIAVPLSVAGGLGLALLLNRRLRAVGLFRTLFYLPSVVPVIATALAWRLMFDRDAGVVNAIIALFGGHAITWLVDPTAFVVLLIMVLWGLGGGMVISLAALQGIPSELTEAAQVDGANNWQAFRSVTLPLLTPILFFQVVTGVIYALQTLVQPLLLSINEAGGGGTVGSAIAVPKSIDLYMVNVYTQFFANDRFGYGSALLWVLFALLIGMTLLFFRSSSLWVYYEVDADKS